MIPQVMEKEKTKQDETASHHYDISMLSNVTCFTYYIVCVIHVLVIFIFCFERSLTLISFCFYQVIILIFSKIINLIIHP